MALFESDQLVGSNAALVLKLISTPQRQRCSVCPKTVCFFVHSHLIYHHIVHILALWFARYCRTASCRGPFLFHRALQSYILTLLKNGEHAIESEIRENHFNAQQ